MYIKKIELENIKSFKKFKWDLSENEDPAGWHVLLGKNGAGKSTFIRSAAVALIGPIEALKSRAVFSDWVRKGEESGFIRIEITQDSMLDNWTVKEKQNKNNISFSTKISIEGDISKVRKTNEPERTVWNNKTGWFSASYGPFRRFSGGNSDYQKLFYSSPLLARHLSIFGEDVALTETLEWLKELRFKELEDSGSSSSTLLNNLIKFINQDDFLPNGVTLDSISSQGIVFTDAFGTRVNLEDLSDGYRSILSMMLELIRQMVNCYKTSNIFDSECNTVIMPGVVFIDEVDVHLHASWQRKIGFWLTQHFPRIQFIVSTHSALICQSAENGSIWKLPSSDGRDKGERIEGIPLKRLIFGNLIEAFSSGAFGSGIERSDKSAALLEELAELNFLSYEDNFSDKQKARKEELSDIFALDSNVSR
ncbi:MAG: AAA family ATPase [Psychromonas sp.]|nr:AAA family ATPase [Psychromonas sp.]